MPTFLRTTGALLLVVALAACPRDDGAVEREDGAQIGAEFEDANVLADLNGHLAASIEASQIAEERATHAEVRQFAQTVRADHQQKQQEIANIMQQHGLVGVGADETGAIGDHSDAVADLRGQEAGEDFDRAYMDRAVDYHRTMLDRLDNAIDRTERADFRQSLQGMRPTIEQHLREAEQLRDRIRES
jgi:putative membrane protein